MPTNNKLKAQKTLGESVFKNIQDKIEKGKKKKFNKSQTLKSKHKQKP